MNETPHDPGAPLIVAIGASAGGLEALRQLFAHLPSDLGMGFVVIQHLDPARPSMLARILETVTRLPTLEAESGMPVQADRVHVIPAGSDLTIHQGRLALVNRQRTGGLHLPIDSFFRALAEDSGGRSIGVVLSGSGADGTEGLRAIKAAGGIAMVQAPDSAQFRSMPDSAIATGVVDFRGDSEAIAAELARLSRHPYVAESTDTGDFAPADERGLSTILTLVRQHAGLDFRGYKRTTIQRRIQRRMALGHAATLDEYAATLRDDVAESKALAQDMLIHVTSFFRDPDAFDALKQHVFKPLLERKTEDDTIRIWIPGCSTGEEAYAITMCLAETLEGHAEPPAIKVFGSDLSDAAIETARMGRYTEAAVANVSADRVQRFFERSEGSLRITRRIRDLVVFVKHDLTRDPPFARLDLISCRNVLIYFDGDLQRRVIPMLHYCLRKQGCLFLGRSETIAGFSDQFSPVDKEQRIFVKVGESTRLIHALSVDRESEGITPASNPAQRRVPSREAQTQADHLLLTRYAPPGAIVNDRLEIIQFRGRTGTYFEPAPGQPQANVLKMARNGLVAHLHDALDRARTQSSSVRKEGLRLQDGVETRVFNLEVIPLTASEEREGRHYLILFEEPSLADRGEQPAARREVPPAEQAVEEAERLRAELVATKDYLQSLISDHQSSTDELAATNEELVAANEELQSTNEELQSAKEELQSTNEELGTVNDQLRGRNQELDEVASDLVNVLASVEIPVIIVDMNLRVRRFTPMVKQVARFIPEDVGRPIDDLKLKMQIDDLPARIRSVIDALAPMEWEIQDLAGSWYRMQIRPYRTMDNRLDGAVISFVEIDALKHALMDAERARDYAQSIVETVSSALVVLDENLLVKSANEAFLDMFALSAAAAGKRSVFDLNQSVFGAPAVRRAIEEAHGRGSRFSGVEVTFEMPSRVRRTLSLSGRPILWGSGASNILLAIEDVTGRIEMEAERGQLLASERMARQDAERANRAKDLFLATLSHELRTPLSTVLTWAQTLRRLAAADQRIERASAAIERSAKSQARLIDDLLDVSRIVSGKLLLDLGPVDLAEVVQEAIEGLRPSAKAKGLELTTAVDHEIGLVYGDAARLTQVVSNLVTNAIKFTPHTGHVSVRLERIGDRAQLTVTDTGIGIRPEVLPQLFNRFVQADSTVTRTHGGLGLGLSIVRHLAEVHGGEVHAQSAGEGKGSTFRVTLPLGAATIPRASGDSRPATGSIDGIRVLLVEDDEDTREAYATMLTQLGAEVRAVPSAASGLAALEESIPDVILSDVAMPGEDGISFIQKVRRLDPDRGGRVPAAAMTALASNDDKSRVLQAGFQTHVAKPVDAARLASVVVALADRSRPEKDSERKP